MTRHEEVVAAAVGDQERRDREAVAAAVGRAVNPDTGVPFPTASQAQLELADELLDRLTAPAEVGGTVDLGLVRDALVEAVVRQHGRTLRSCLAEVRAEADRLDDTARGLAEDATDSPVIDANKLGQAARLVGAAWSLRALHLYGDRA